MPETVEAEIDANGNIRLLQPLPVKTPRRVLVTFLESDAAPTDEQETDKPETSMLTGAAVESRRQMQMEWLKANNDEYGGQYVALVGNQLIGTGKTFREANEAAREADCPDAFVTYLPKKDEVLEVGGWK
ncbi:MAG: DUF5678 domain-containing protein [Blastocatellales bacterium]